MLAIMSRKPAGLPDISRPTSKPSVMPSSFCTSASLVSRTSTARVTPILRARSRRYGFTSVITVKRAPACARHRGGHDADGAGAGDQHVLAQHREGERGVHRVAERIENGGDIERRCRRGAARCWSWAARCIRRTRPAGSRPRPWCARTGGGGPARQLRQRPQTTWPSPLTISPGKKSATLEPTSTISPDEFVADRHGHGNGLLRPVVPFVDVDVGAADAGAQHADQHVVDADLGDVDVFQPQARLAPALHQCFHIHYDTRSGAEPSAGETAASPG